MLLKKNCSAENSVSRFCMLYLLAMFNQLSGINAILYYAPRIFEMAGFSQTGFFSATGLYWLVPICFSHFLVCRLLIKWEEKHY